MKMETARMLEAFVRSAVCEEDRAEVTCVARDFYFPLPAEFRPQEGGPGRRPASWDAFRKNWDGRVITFAFDK